MVPVTWQNVTLVILVCGVVLPVTAITLLSWFISRQVNRWEKEEDFDE